MSDTKTHVNESDINDELMQQYAVKPAKTLTIKLPRIPKPHFKKPFLRLSPLVLITILVLLVGAGGGLGYQKYASLKKENQRLANPQAAADDEATRVKAEVAQLIELPDEKPTIATVVDVDKLKGQAFFANARNGDRILVFAEAKRAVLYRPSSKKIVEVAPFNIGSNGVAGASTTTTTPPTIAPTTKKP